MKLSVFTPLPPAPTGIADYSALLLEELGKLETPWDVEAVAAPKELDLSTRLPVYHLGNSEHHDFIYPYALHTPGVLVLHDLVLHHARLSGYLNSDAVTAYRADLANREKRSSALEALEGYRSEVREAYPDSGEAIAEIAMRMGGGRLLYDYPLYEHLVRKSRLTLVHSTTALETIREHVPDAALARIRMGMPLPTPVPREDARRKLGISQSDDILLMSFGLVTPEKRISTALRAIARMRAKGWAVRYVLVGGSVEHYDPRAEANELGIADAVELTGRVPDDAFWLYAFAADVCLNLRYPSAGETSATLLRLLACGRPVVVTDQSHALDFPDRVVARSSLEGEEDGLYCDLVDLLRDHARRRSLSEASRAFVEREHSPAVMAQDYVAALKGL